MIVTSVKKLFGLVDLRSASCFVSVGALSAIVYFGVFTICWKYFGFPNKLAVSIGYVLSVVVHFLGNRHLTFRDSKHHISKQLIRYLTMIFFNYLVTLVVVHFVVNIGGFSPYLGLVCAIATTVGSGYLISKYWVFRAHDV